MIGKFLPVALAMAIALSGCDLESTAAADRQGTSLALNAFARDAATLPPASRIEIVFSCDSGTKSIDTVHSGGTPLVLGRVDYGKDFSVSVLGYDTSSNQKVVRWYGSATGSADGYDVQQVSVPVDTVGYQESLTYAGQTYRTTKIGDKIWMAENLNYKGTGSDGLGRCYGDSSASCTRYGRLYTWAEAMGLDAAYDRKASGKATTSGLQGICPVGWHVPDSAEWNALIRTVGGADSAGYELKANSALWKDGSGLLDARGFSVLPGSDGITRATTIYDDADLAIFLSATESDDSSQVGYSISSGSPTTNSFPGRKFMDLSLRCVKD